MHSSVIEGDDQKNCSQCKNGFSVDERLCSYCEYDIGFPNVRYADRKIEISALNNRVEKLKNFTKKKNISKELSKLHDIAENGEVVINRSLSQLADWTERSDQRYLNFYEKTSMGFKSNDDFWNRQRRSAENTVSPIFFERLCIAVFSPNERGMPYYGDYSLSLRREAIIHRATLFEENPFIFNERHKVFSGQEPPVGYRASWGRRRDLISAKLGRRLRAGMAPDEIMATLLSEERGGSAACDFVEVHIYGSIHISAIKKVVGPRPVEKADALIWSRMKLALERAGAEVVEC